MAIIVMNDGTELDFDKDWSSIILSESPRCKKVCFDLSLLKKRDKVYSAYKIPQSERILAFCKDSVAFIPITTGGIVFTNQAVYCCPAIKLEDGSEQNRISYTVLDSCIITQEGANGGVYICKQDSTLQLYDPTLIAKNVAGHEIKQILCKAQHQLFQRDAAAKSRVDALATLFLQKAKDEMGIDEISSKTLGILDSLMEFQEHADTAAMLKAEYIFREFKPEKYEKFVATLPSIVSWDVKAAIKSVPSSFAENYILTLTDLEHDFPYRSLSEIYKRISSLEKKDQSIDMFRAYLCIRMVNNDWIDTQISELRRKYGKDVAEKLEWFRCIYFYHEMHKVYKAITSDKAYPDAYLRLRDGLGLTPLHYAIILKNEKAIKHLLEQQDWKFASPYGSSALPFRMYDYTVLAAGKQLPNIQDVLQKTHEGTIELRDTIKNITGRLKYQKAVYWIQDTNLIAHRMDYTKKKFHHASKDELERISANISAIKDNLNTAEDNAASLAEMLHDCEDSIVYVMECAIDEALSFLEDMRNKNLPLANYLYRIYFEPDFLKKVLRAVRKKRDLRLYNYKGFYFVAPAFAEIDLPYQGEPSSDEDTKKEACAEDKPLYGNSWFSNDAHHNIDVLKSEYRRLAKTYHPDVCKLPNSNQLFQSISAEYGEVYKSILNAPEAH